MIKKSNLLFVVIPIFFLLAASPLYTRPFVVENTEALKRFVSIFSTTSVLLLALMIYVAFYIAGYKKQVRRLLGNGEAEETGTKHNHKNNKKKYAASGLTPGEADSLLRRLMNFMESEKPYLDSGLTLRDLARRTSMTQKDLSRIVNEKLNKNFWAFINDYRIDEAKRLLLSNRPQRSVIEVAYESGFNSKSSFNEVFKKYMDMTPTRFRQLSMEKNPAK